MGWSSLYLKQSYRTPHDIQNIDEICFKSLEQRENPLIQ
jgi:hypothetical protein